MVKFTSEELSEVMDKKNNIRNMSVIGHMGHGKSALTDSLVAAAGIIMQEAEDEFCMSGASMVEAQGGARIRPFSLFYKMPAQSLNSYLYENDGKDYLINLIDSPGHVDFSSEVRSALRISDGALLVVDCIEGVGLQTEKVLRVALGERITPVLTVNKIDKLFFEGVKGDDIYQIFLDVIHNANLITEAYNDPHLGDVQFCPEKGNVAFSSATHGWAFTLKHFAKMYAPKFGVEESVMMERLWGDNFYDSVRKKWTKVHTGSFTCKRGFVMFCCNPINQMIADCMANEKGKLSTRLQKLGLSMKPDEKELMGKALAHCVMQIWLPASTAILELMVLHSPSPSKAQIHRVENLYLGSLDDEYAEAIRNCDPKGPLMLYISKMIPAEDGNFFAFGRVFSGIVGTGMKVRIMGPKYVSGKGGDLYVESIQRCVTWIGKKLSSVETVPCGNTVMIVGLDRWISNCATLTNENEVHASAIKPVNCNVPHIVHRSVNCKVASNLPKLLEGLKWLSKCDPAVHWITEETGEYIIFGVGEFHLEICLKDLQKRIMGDVELTISPTIVNFRETVLDKSTVLVRSKNGQNSIHMEARPLEEGLAEAIDDGRIGPGDDPEMRSKILSEEFGWNMLSAKKIWCFGPRTTGPNIVVDMCKGVQYREVPVHGSVVSAFHQKKVRWLRKTCVAFASRSVILLFIMILVAGVLIISFSP